jgi:AcrR family transcriptional regulator
MGLRESNKQDKRERLSRAARELFSEQGFEATTIRQIAERAGIGVGTIFLYARDKPGLLFLLFSEAVLAVEQQAFATLPTAEGGAGQDRASPKQSRPGKDHRDGEPLILRQLVHVFSAFYRYYMTDRQLARLFVKELLFLDSSRGPAPEPVTGKAAAAGDPTRPAEAGVSDAEKHIALTMNFLGRLAALVAGAQARGELRDDFDPLTATMNFFAIYFLTLVGLLDPVHGRSLDAELATVRLRDSLQLQISGLLPPRAERSQPRRASSAAGPRPRPARRK